MHENIFIREYNGGPVFSEEENLTIQQGTSTQQGFEWRNEKYFQFHKPIITHVRPETIAQRLIITSRRSSYLWRGVAHENRLLSNTFWFVNANNEKA